MGSRRNTRRVTGARPGGFILIQRCTTHDRLRFRGPQHHAPQSGTRRVPALRFRGIMKPFSALSSKLKIIRATASAHSSTSSALPSVATKIDQYPYASLRLPSNVVIGNTRAGRVPPPPQPCFARVLPINAKGLAPLTFTLRKSRQNRLVTLTIRAKFMLIAPLDKHSCGKRQAELSWDRLRCHGEKSPQILVSVFRPTCLVFVLYLIGR